MNTETLGTDIRLKYPRTFHIPFSEGISSDDKVMNESDFKTLLNKTVIITEKMDGENTTLYPFGLHARSTTSAHHPSRSWLKSFHASICDGIPIGWRVCGENLFAKHSIFYENLESYFYGFSVWTDKNYALPWWETFDWLQLMGITPVNVLYLGIATEDTIKKVISSLDTSKQEGIVIRSTNGFHYDDFSKNVCKWVRKNHVTTNDHWMNQELIPNKLKLNTGETNYDGNRPKQS
jgi:hypothetical protein